MIENPPPWPNNYKCAVSITFDMDADSLIHLERPNDSFKRVSTISQLRYGPDVAVSRILGTYKRLGLRQTFFVPAWCVAQYPDVIRRIVDHGHEIGHHGYLHENPLEFNRDAQALLLDKGIDIIQQTTGVAPVGYRAPLYNYTNDTTDLLIERGFKYDASLMGDDIPYILRSQEKTLIELPSHWGCDDWPPFAHVPDLDYQMPVRSPSAGLNAFIEEFEAAYRWGGLFIPVWHPFVTGRLARWSAVEDWLCTLVAREDIWFAPMCEIAAHIQQIWDTGTHTPRIDTLPYYKGPVS